MYKQYIFALLAIICDFCQVIADNVGYDIDDYSI